MIINILVTLLAIMCGFSCQFWRFMDIAVIAKKSKHKVVVLFVMFLIDNMLNNVASAKIKLKSSVALY